MTAEQPTRAATATDRVCPFWDPVQCQECGAIMERARAENSCWRVAAESRDHPAEYILVCPVCNQPEPTYETPDACDDCDGTKCSEG